MNINTGTDYWNGHYAVALGALNVFYLHKMYFWGHINSLYKKIHPSIAKLTFQGGKGNPVVGSGMGPTVQRFLLLKYIEITSGCSTAKTGVNRSRNE